MSANFRDRTLAEKAIGPEHIKLSGHLNDLGRLYTATGEYAKAASFYRRTVTINEQKGTIGNPDAQAALFDLAQVYVAQGMVTEAVKLQARANEVEKRYLELNLAVGSEREKASLLASLSAHAARNISLHANLAPYDPVALNLAITTILQRKGRVQDVMSAGLAALRLRLSAEDQKLLDQLNSVTSRLANLVLTPPARMSAAQRQAAIEILERKREGLEGDVSRLSAGFYSRPQPVTLEAVQAALPNNSTLIEFEIYRPFDPKCSDNSKAYGAPRYIAYVLRNSGSVLWKDLGEVATVDERIEAFRRALLNSKARDVKQLARLLDERLVQPIRALIGDTAQVIVSADGALNLVPFDALVDEEGKYLIERYAINYLTSGRDLLRLQVERQSKSEPLLIADPVFGEPPARGNESRDQAKASHGRNGSVTSARDLSSIYFTSLSGTAPEARAIKQLFPDAKLFTGQSATELTLKQALAPRILHIATHGFFLADEPPQRDTASAIKRIRTENPLLRSGLALTGANLRKNSGEDGILTALEASGLNLWGTKLVTLSACDTGIGEIRNGDGVYGLRRALVLAGAESLVMSLWPVSDYVTRELMTSYYQGLKQGLGRREALRQVQLGMLRRKAREHPYYWASFIESGEWANLDGRR